MIPRKQHPNLYDELGGRKEEKQEKGAEEKNEVEKEKGRKACRRGKEEKNRGGRKGKRKGIMTMRRMWRCRVGRWMETILVPLYHF